MYAIATVTNSDRSGLIGLTGSYGLEQHNVEPLEGVTYYMLE